MTTIYTIRNNLLQIIAGKEMLLEEYRKGRLAGGTIEQDIAWFASNVLKANIDELKRILADVEVCCEQASARAWQGYLDRQAGI